MPKYEITKGSISDLMQQDDVSLAESFLSCNCVVLFDVSGSMKSEDGTGATRFERGLKELKEVQATMPGRFAIIQFADRVNFMPGGVPTMWVSGAGTDLTAALKYAQIADEIPDMRFIVISDGEPDNRLTAKAVAAQYKNRIDTIYIGEETGRGRSFLTELAEASGGSALSSAAENIQQDIVYLLQAGQ